MDSSLFNILLRVIKSFGFYSSAHLEVHLSVLYGFCFGRKVFFIWLTIPILLYLVFLSPWCVLVICFFAHTWFWFFIVLLLLQWILRDTFNIFLKSCLLLHLLMAKICNFMYCELIKLGYFLPLPFHINRLCKHVSMSFALLIKDGQSIEIKFEKNRSTEILRKCSVSVVHWLQKVWQTCRKSKIVPKDTGIDL